MNFIIVYNLFILVVSVSICFLIFYVSDRISSLCIIVLFIVILYIYINGYNIMINRTEFHKNIKEHLSVIRTEHPNEPLKILGMQISRILEG